MNKKACVKIFFSVLMGLSLFFLSVAYHSSRLPVVSTAPPLQAMSDQPPEGVAVYALSRGKGVPDAARSVLDKAKEMFQQGKEQGHISSVKQTRIGLEGETRVCAEFTDRSAMNQMLNELHRLAEGVELVNVKMEACS